MSRYALFAASAALAGLTATAAAQFAGETPTELEGIQIEDRSGAQVPGDLAFVDENGAAVRLSDYLGRGRPVVVQLVYYNCPMLCTLVLNGFVEGASGLQWSPGSDYDVLTVSIDPRDAPQLAAAKKKNYVAALGRPEAEEGWHFLTGEEPAIRELAGALGFGYRWVEEKKEYAHAAGMFVLTPEGTVSRTLYGIEFTSKDLRLSLIEAAEGRLGSPLDRLLLYCFQYDPEKHKYALVAVNVMKIGGLLTVAVLGGLLTVLWVRERRRVPRAPALGPRAG